MKKAVNYICGIILSGLCLSCTVTAAENESDNFLNVIAAPADILEVEDGYLVTDTYNRVILKVSGEETEVYAGALSVKDLYGQPMGGYEDAKNESCYFKLPWAIAPFLNGYAVSDPNNQAVRFLDETEERTKTVNAAANVQDLGTEVEWERPMGLAADEQGNLFVADAGTGKISKIDPAGRATVELEDLSEPTGLCWKNGALYIAETGKHRIMKYMDGSLICVAGTGINGKTDGDLSVAQLTCPQGIEVADDGTLFIADTGNSAVRMVADGKMTTMLIAEPGSLIQYPAEPLGMMCKDGLLYVCDHFSRSIYMLEY